MNATRNALLRSSSRMTNMILSPMQQDDATRGEFEGLKTLMNEGFEKSFEMSEAIEKKVDKNSEYVEDGFDKVFKQIDAVEENLIGRFDIVEEKVDSAIDQIKLLTTTVNSVSNQMALLTKVVTDTIK